MSQARTYQTTAEVCEQCGRAVGQGAEGGDQGYSGCCNEPMETRTVTVTVDEQGTSRITKVHEPDRSGTSGYYSQRFGGIYNRNRGIGGYGY